MTDPRRGNSMMITLLNITSTDYPAITSKRVIGPMQWDAVVVWVCSAIMIICQGDTAPTVASLQTTYEREATPANTLHDKGLRLLEAKCDNGAAGRFLCQVTFLSTSDPAQRLYFDIIAVTRTTDGWALKSGLCKR